MNRGNFLHIIKAIMWKPQLISYLVVKDWMLFPLDEQQDKNTHFFAASIHHSMGSSSQGNWQEK